jgi:tripeptidyl-peptidase-1
MKLLLASLLLLAVVASATISNERTVMYNRKAIPSQWKFAGLPLSTDTVRFALALKQRNLDLLEQRFWAISTPGSPLYREFMTREAVYDLIAPSKEDHDTVVAFLWSQGIKEIRSTRDGLMCTTTVEVAEKFFNTKFYVFTHAWKKNRVVKQMGEFSIPVFLAQYIDLIEGVSNFPMYNKLKRTRAPTAPLVDAAVVPATLDTIYNVPAGTSANGANQGVIEFGAGEYYNPSSLQTFAKGVGVTIPPLNSSHVINPQPPEGIEGVLDIQYLGGVGAGGDNWYWTENDWLYSWSSSFFAAANIPDVVSVSYGWAEYDQCDVSDECSTLGTDSQGFVLRVNTEFQKIGVRGTSIVVASGDSGANGRTDPDCTQKVLHPDYPACSPYVTSVGATQLNNPETNLQNPPPICKSGQWQCASGGSESAVSYEVSSFTSGGGFSNYAAQPSYQSTVVANYLKTESKLPPSTYFNASGRAYPDIAALGHNFLCYSADEGGWFEVGGTSASSPTIGAYMSFLNSVARKKTGKPLGFLNPLLYTIYSAQPSAFRDITTGDNLCTEDGCASSCKGYYAAVGWDPVTGLGVPNVGELISYINNNL